MKIIIRLTRLLFDQIQDELSRPHSFAFERVGFLFGRSEKVLSDWVVLPTRFESVIDMDYVPDEFVGAKINSNAIRHALQTSMSNSESVFHVHQHGGYDASWFSAVDLKSNKELIPSFSAVSNVNVHGALVLSKDQAAGIAWAPSVKKPIKIKVSIVGFPTTICSPGFGELHE